MIPVPSAITYEGTRYLADGYEMRKQVGEDLYPWGVPVPPAKPTAAEDTGGNIEAGTYRIAVVAQNFLGSKSCPWETESDFDYTEIAVSGDTAKVNVTLPVHGDPQVKRLLVYRTRKNETSPYYFAGYAENGTTTVSLNGADSSLSTVDFLEGPVSDEDSLAGPFRYGRPPVKTNCLVGMNDIVFVFGERAYSDGFATATHGSAEITLSGSAALRAEMKGKHFRFADENVYYTIASVDTDQRMQLSSLYERPAWKADDPDADEYEIIGDPNEVAPSAPGEPEHFCPAERFLVGADEGGRLTGGVAHFDEAVIGSEDHIYLVRKGYQPGAFDVLKTGSAWGVAGPRAIASSHGSVWFFSGSDLCQFNNMKADIVSDKLGKLLRTGVDAMKEYAILAPMGDRIYLAVSLTDPDYLDTIIVYHVLTGDFDLWDTFRIVDMQAVTVPTGRQFLYIECPAGEGYGLYAFTDAALNDGAGAADYSGTVVSTGGNTLTVDADLPTFGLGAAGMRCHIRTGAGAGGARWVESNTEDTLTLDRAWDTPPEPGDTYTLGAVRMDLVTGKLGLPDAFTQQDVKETEFNFGE